MNQHKYESRRDAIERLYRAGMGYDAIRDTLGCSKDTIARVIQKRGLPRRRTGPHPPPDLAEKMRAVRDLHSKGLGLREIGSRVGLAHSTVYYWLNGRHAPRATSGG
jgi:transposase